MSAHTDENGFAVCPLLGLGLALEWSLKFTCLLEVVAPCVGLATIMPTFSGRLNAAESPKMSELPRPHAPRLPIKHSTITESKAITVSHDVCEDGEAEGDMGHGACEPAGPQPLLWGAAFSSSQPGCFSEAEPGLQEMSDFSSIERTTQTWLHVFRAACLFFFFF